MRLIVQRSVLPLLTVAAGIVMLVYGAAFRTAPVWREEMEDREVEQEVVKTNKIAVPIEMLGGPSAFGMPGAEAQPPGSEEPSDGGEVPPPGMKFVTEKMTVIETVTKPVRVTKTAAEPESWLMFAVTVGGVQRRENALWRTYGPNEEPPSLCPT